MSCAWWKYKYEYECISQNDEVVAAGEFIIELPCTIRSSLIVERGISAVFDNDRERLFWYRGDNHLKDIRIKVTNIYTKSVRYFRKE